MTTADKVIKSKVEVLELGKQLGNVSKACRIMGYSRDNFYRFKELSMRHQNGVIIILRSFSRGAKLQVGPGGIKITLKQ
jgi:hypothetical protein